VLLEVEEMLFVVGHESGCMVIGATVVGGLGPGSDPDGYSVADAEGLGGAPFAKIGPGRS
jgi:hypothetical protein